MSADFVGHFPWLRRDHGVKINAVERNGLKGSKAVGDHERGGNSSRREGEDKKERNAGGKKEEEEAMKKSGEPAGRNELEVNQTYRSYRSRYHYHLPSYYVPTTGLYLDSASSLLSDAPPCIPK